MESIDVDATGSIDYDEFLAATMNMSQLQVSSPAGTPCLTPEACSPSQSRLLCCADVPARVPLGDCLCSLHIAQALSCLSAKNSHGQAAETGVLLLLHDRAACADGGEHVPRLPAL